MRPQVGVLGGRFPASNAKRLPTRLGLKLDTSFEENCGNIFIVGQVSFQFHPASLEPVGISLFGCLKLYRSGAHITDVAGV